MKRYIAILFFTLILSGCDDGDLTQTSFDFNDSFANACGDNENNFFIYKTTENKVLILKISPNNFQNLVNEDNPFVLNINNSSNALIYRSYNGNVTNNTICNDIPPATPTVTDEKAALGGEVTIITTATKTSNETEGTLKIDGYIHTIYFNNITFDNQRNESLKTITYRTPAIPLSNFSNTNEVSYCESNHVFYKNNGTQSIVLNLSEESRNYLFDNTINIDKEINLDENNTIIQQIYNTSVFPLTSEYFCEANFPANPPVIESWNSIGGIISVKTEANANGFTHTVTLKNVRLGKDVLEVRLGNTFDLGKYYTIIP